MRCRIERAVRSKALSYRVTHIAFSRQFYRLSHIGLMLGYLLNINYLYSQPAQLDICNRWKGQKQNAVNDPKFTILALLPCTSHIL